MIRRLGLLILVGGLAGGLPGCAPRASDGDFDSDNPAAKLYAIRQAGEAKDRAKIPKLVEQLDSDDPAVRMLSINALERITGQRMGYNPYASSVERRSSMEAWEQAVREGKFAH
jgi:hypothetical protein